MASNRLTERSARSAAKSRAGRPPRSLTWAMPGRAARGGGPKVENCSRDAAGQRALDAALVEIEQLRRQRAVGRRAEAGAGQRRLQARLEVLADQRRARLDRVQGQMVEADLALGVEIGGQRHEVGMEQRQPVLHAREGAASLDRLQQRIAGHRPELPQVAGLEALDRRRRRAGPRSPASARARRPCASERWVSGSKERINSRVEPKKSSRTGWSSPLGKMSTRPPRTA